MADLTMTLSFSEVQRLLKSAAITPKRSLGQNFVVDPNTVRRMARLAGVGNGSRVLEIGAGLGSLTLALAETGAQVTAIETDRALIPLLKDAVGNEARIIEADVRALSWNDVVPTPGWHLVANLPYNIATTLVLTVLDEVPNINRLLVMVQQEAGERIAASVGNPAYGAVSVRVALRGQASIVGQVPPSVFYPRPRVNSVVVAIERVEKNIELKVENQVIELLRIAFNQRRKMLRKSLKGHLREGTIERAHISPTSRPEELDLGQWIALAQLSSLGEP
ncbi:MAG: 16S rRNA (adenine(1518)-N(6)/adenine(1519)-N(6))-dimethyltransferase RsmA [Actinomycetota bacterium]|nr:16S rRNA (adenine(1518)-N(6)/adenine(1519)-N(6))-dimethyltransferase RsmA [Actinomycetota bacterium]